MEFDVVRSIYERHSDNLLVLSNLPFNDDVFKLINGNSHEKAYWQDKSPYLDNEFNFECRV